MSFLTPNGPSSFTPDDKLDLFFAAELISDDLKRQLPSDVHVRPLSSTDYRRGHLAVLSVLTVVSDPGEEAWVNQFTTMRNTPNTYYPIVIVDKMSDKVVGVGCVFLERKFLRGLASVGHIEDIAVDKSQQGKKLGLRIIQVLTQLSEQAGCYKTILNCSDANIPFYEKCGFVKKENEMAKYAPEERPQTPLPSLMTLTPLPSRASSPRL
ncbi:Glucosamine-phosphate N-acetyltransferase-like protein [Marasmius crinis-equi]|uniref:Glucosamine 6-phosphate N-acetyltransferase n=1 Tax=Marasmius crinis-equi TaxID=585013 RepID=A0ABR3F6M0_9AGAR